MRWVRIDQQIVCRKVIVLITFNFLVDLKRYICFNLEYVFGFEHFDTATIAVFYGHNELQVNYLVHRKAIQKCVAKDLNLKSIDAPIKNDLGRHKLGKP